MRKSRKSAIIKRVVTRSVSSTNSKFTTTFGGGLNNTAELSLMAREEWEQRLVDNFWGLDKDLRDRNQEIALMAEEDRSSMFYETSLRIQQLHSLWDQEYIQQEQQTRRTHRQTNAMIRTDHLKLINSPIPVENILKVLWNSNPNQSFQSLQEFIPPSLNDTTRRFRGSGSGGGDASVGTAGATLDSVHMSLHLEGLQRSREILDNAKTSYRKVIKELKNLDLLPSMTPNLSYIRTNSSGVPVGTMGGGGGGGGSPSQITAGGFDSSFGIAAGGSSMDKVNHAGSIFTNEETKQSQSRSIYSTIQEVSQALGFNNSSELSGLPVYNDALEGHSLYKWDQEIMIQTAFNLLDRGNKGYLTKDDLSLIANDLTIHNLLKYTVFWSVIKRREWFIFENLLQSAVMENTVSTTTASNKTHPLHTNTNNVTIAPLIKQKSTSSIRSSHSAQGGIGGGSANGGGGGGGGGPQHPSIYKFQQHPKESISYFQLLDCALSLSKEIHCHLQFIRTQEEHEYYTSLNLTPNNHNQGSSSSRKRFPSNYFDHESNGIIRHFRVMRKLSVGDCVWALHRRGVRWLPAVIMKIHYPKSMHSVGGVYSPFKGLPREDSGSMSVIKEEGESYYDSPTKDRQQQSPPTLRVFVNREENYYYYYDLWFPLNEKELMKSRMTTISRQLLTLPSQSSQMAQQQQSLFSPFASTISENALTQHNKSNNNHHNNQVSSFLFGGKDRSSLTAGGGGSSSSQFYASKEEEALYLNAIPPKPFDTEKQVCSYAFDLIDSNSCGIVNLLLLTQSMQSKELIQILNTSLILSLIFRTNQSLEEILLTKDDALQELLALEHTQSQLFNGTDPNAPPGQNHTNHTNENGSLMTNENSNSVTSQTSVKQHQDIFPIPCMLSVFIDTFTTETEDEEQTRHAVENLNQEKQQQKRQQQENDVNEFKELKKAAAGVFLTNVPDQSHLTGGVGVGGDGGGGGGGGLSEETSQTYSFGEFDPSENGSQEGKEVDLQQIEQENVKYMKLQKKINQISSEYISKMDFLEFCEVIYSLIKFNLQFITKLDLKVFQKLKKKSKTKRVLLS